MKRKYVVKVNRHTFLVDGEMKMSERNRQLTIIKEKANVKVLLLSFKAGGVGTQVAFFS